MIVEPIAVVLMRSAITWRWREPRSNCRASPPLTPPLVASRETSPAAGACRSIAITMPAHTTSTVALSSRRLLVPTCWTASAVTVAPVAPPRLAPPPMKPNKRLACRASYTSLASVQNWLMSRIPITRPNT